MNSGLSRGYAHRQNADGTFDSICLSCFLTIISANSESQLTEAETQHSCDPGDVLGTDAKCSTSAFEQDEHEKVNQNAGT